MNVFGKSSILALYLGGVLLIIGTSAVAQTKNNQSKNSAGENKFWPQEFSVDKASFDEKTADFFSSFFALSTNESPSGTFYRVLIDSENKIYMDYRAKPSADNSKTLVELRFPQILKREDQKKAAKNVFLQISKVLASGSAPSAEEVGDAEHPGMKLYATANRIFGQKRYGTAARLYSRFVDTFLEESQFASELVHAAFNASVSFDNEKRPKKRDEMCAKTVSFVKKFGFSPDTKEGEMATKCGAEAPVAAPALLPSSPVPVLPAPKESVPVPDTLEILDNETSQRSNGILDADVQLNLESRYRALFLKQEIDRFTVEEFKYNTQKEVCSVTLRDGVTLEKKLSGDCTDMLETGAVLPTTHGSIWRIEGAKSELNGYVFTSDETDPLRFILLKNKGLVYLFGKGSVTDKSGKKTYLHNATSNGVQADPTPPDPICQEGTVLTEGGDGVKICETKDKDKNGETDVGVVQGPPTPPSHPSTRSPLIVAGVTAFIVGAVATGAGIAVGIAAVKKNDKLEDKCGTDPICDVTLADDIKTRDKLAKAATPLIVGGIITASAGAALYIVGKVKQKRQKKTSRLFLHPFVSSEVSGLVLSGAF